MALSKIDTAAIATDAIEAAQLKSDAIAVGDLPTGSVLQVVNTVKTDTFSTSSLSFVAVTGLSASITPSSTSSKILIAVNVHFSGNTGLASTNLALAKGGSVLTAYTGDASGNRPRVAIHSFAGDGAASGTDNELYNGSVQVLDSPATTSATTYSVMMKSSSSSYTNHVNRTISNRNTSNYEPLTISTITLMEIAG